MNYEYHSHTHCYDQENPPCGLKHKDNCCLCDKKKVPEKEEVATPTVQHSMKCPKLYGETCTCTPKPPKEEELSDEEWGKQSAFPKEEWEKAFVKTFYVSNLVRGTHIGAEKDALAFIDELIFQTKSTTRRETLEEVSKEVQEHIDIINKQGGELLLKGEMAAFKRVLVILSNLNKQ